MKTLDVFLGVRIRPRHLACLASGCCVKQVSVEASSG